jgi:hypothetical protein
MTTVSGMKPGNSSHSGRVLFIADKINCAALLSNALYISALPENVVTLL